ncbi:unnamed protein product [Clonostachys rosea]|uniref:Heterokaryon incompatibility domain-containing protein n=1 Tax=Bionectria ochroleuca TaxID=29856 RepID=A0ABY6TUW8_BIOOC|nr:unnamed protein product [Clonostachys rosea]
MSVTDEQDTRSREIYRPLDFSKNEIRVLRVRHDDIWDRKVPLRLDLYHVSLEQDKHTSNWGVYNCLSYIRRDSEGEKATVFINGVATSVDKYLEHALRDIGQCEHGPVLWIDALSINHDDMFDRNQHVLRRKDIFSHAWRIIAWGNDSEELMDYELGYNYLDELMDAIMSCSELMTYWGRRALEEALGVRRRDWGADEQEDKKIRELTAFPIALMFEEHLGVDSGRELERWWDDDEDRHEPEPCNVRFLDVIQLDLLTMLQKEYWSCLEIIQELTENPDKTFLHWGNPWGGMGVPFPVFLALCDILLTYHEREEPADPELWKKLKPKLDLWLFIARRKALETATGGAVRLDNAGIRELNALVTRATCTLPQDRVYAILGLFPPSVLGAVTVDYNQDAAVTMAQFCSAVPGWNCNRLEPRSDSDDD